MQKRLNTTHSESSFRDRFITALVLGGVIGILLGSAIKMFYTPIRTVPQEMRIAAEKKKKVSSVTTGGESIHLPDTHPAMTYIKAYQTGDWDTVIEKTLWIQERLKYISKLYGGDTQKINAEKKEIEQKIKERDINKNFLTKEGVEDQYLFSPDAKVSVIKIDKEGPFNDPRIKERVSLFIEYPKPSKALRSEEKLPIKSLIAIISLNDEGKVVKSSIIGNIEITYSSIKLWDTTEGGN